MLLQTQDLLFIDYHAAKFKVKKPGGYSVLLIEAAGAVLLLKKAAFNQGQ
jgi:hypothetical protein